MTIKMRYSEGGKCYATSLKKKKGAEASQDAFESTPTGDVPTCAGCEEPMTALAILHRHNERFPLSKHEALGVYVCSRESGDDWDDWWKKCALANQIGGAKGGLTAVLYDKAPSLKKKGKLAHYTLIDDVAEDYDPEDEDNEHPPLPYGGAKFKGVPFYGGFGGDVDFRPKCKTCKKEMRFMGQLTSDGAIKFDAGDGFWIFIFMCAEHSEVKLEAVVA
jgi:hypothetical protein